MVALSATDVSHHVVWKARKCIVNCLDLSRMRNSTARVVMPLGQTRKWPLLNSTPVLPSRADVFRLPEKVRFVPSTEVLSENSARLRHMPPARK